MAGLAYVAVGPDGRRIRGRAECDSPEELRRNLERRDLLLVRTTEGRSRAFAFSIDQRGSDIHDFVRTLAALLSSGMPLDHALEATEDVVSTRIRDPVRRLRDAVRRGVSLSEGLAAQDAVFPSVIHGLVRGGERSGDLAGALARVEAQLERREELKSRLLTASLYPALLVSVGGAALLFILLFVLPRFGELIGDVGAALPRSTSVLLAGSELLRTQWYWWVLPVIGLIALTLTLLRTRSGRLYASRLLSRLPIIGSLRRELLSTRFARALGSLLEGGELHLSALEASVDSLSDPLGEEAVRRIRGKVREGASLADAVSEEAVFSPLLQRLIRVGERSGDLPRYLMKAADLHESRLERSLSRAVALVEPVLIIAFGGVIALVAFALLQAIYGVNAGSFG